MCGFNELDTAAMVLPSEHVILLSLNRCSVSQRITSFLVLVLVTAARRAAAAAARRAAAATATAAA